MANPGGVAYYRYSPFPAWRGKDDSPVQGDCLHATPKVWQRNGIRYYIGYLEITVPANA